MKHKLFMAFLGLSLLWATACEKTDTPDETFSFDFAQQQHGWAGGFADYTDEYENLDLKAEMAPLPDPLNPTGKITGFKIQGNNRPDDLFMFIKRKVTGLKPNLTYNVGITMQLASDAPKDAVGIGGAPGEAVFLKAGAVTSEPVVSKNAAGRYLINLDKGNQGQGGKDMKVIGNVAKADDKPGYASLTRKADGITVRTNAQGECWLIIGADSGYEGMTRLYFQQIEVELTEL